MKTELLAPAGDLEAGYAALYYGADAVYLGLQKFSARSTAINFNADNLGDFIGYAHSVGRKVYVTVNTILQTKELSALLEILDTCAFAKADAVIVQDLGVARVVKESYPELNLHASTQMAVHNLQGAITLKKIGFKRVVLARELTLNEIREIKEKSGVDIEVFIHGALCYSYSGLCLFSSLMFGKSANRGKCLYPCRENFQTENGKERHLFSMKDLALGEDILKLSGLSLKIEGRKKNALYVAAVTDYYRSILDGKKDFIDKEENLKQIFARPWTKLHFNGKNKNVIDKEFVGHRGLPIGQVNSVVKGVLTIAPTHSIEKYDGIQIDVEGLEKPYGFSLEKMKVHGKFVFKAFAGQKVEIILPPKAPFIRSGDKVYLASSSFVKGAYSYKKPKPNLYAPRYSINVEVIISPQQITAVSEGSTAELTNLDLKKAAYPDKVSQAVSVAFDKTDKAPFILNELKVYNPEQLFVPVSFLNDLRRQLYKQIKIKQKKHSLPKVQTKQSSSKFQYIIKTDCISSLSLIDFSKVDEIIISLSPETNEEDLKILPKNKVRLSLPTVCRNVEIFYPKIAHLLSCGYYKWEIGNVWGIEVLSRAGVDLSFDSSIYIMNPQAVQMAKELGANRVTFSPEDTLENMKTLAAQSPLPIVLPVYTDPPLFISANCLRENPCLSCNRGTKQSLIHAKGKNYQIISKDCLTMLFFESPLYLMKEAQIIRPDFVRIDFVGKTYSSKQALDIFENVFFHHELKTVVKGNIQREI